MPADSLEGQNLGKYRVLEPLGRGGMARVYRAYHPQLDRYVAIKVLRSDLVDEEQFLARFKREAKAVASLRHPNIVQVFDCDVQDDAYYMVMELLEADNLAMRLDDYHSHDERIQWGEMVRILLDVLDALAYAHSEGMIHRDVKPANILLTRRGQAVLTDFGIAQIVGGTRYTVSGALMGTLSYMAPEQGLEGQCDARSDIYSLGIVLYEMMIGEPPFDAETPLAILMKHVNDPLPLPRQKDPTIPVPFERVVLKALAKRPQDRYQSAEEMAQALREAAAEVGVQVPGRIGQSPASFTTPEAPSESVAVLSGSARAKVTDAGFAAHDTDALLGQRLAAERAAEVGVPAPPPKPAPPAKVVAAKGGIVINIDAQTSPTLAKIGKAADELPGKLRVAADKLAAKFDEAAEKADEEPKKAAKGHGETGVVNVVWLLVMVNLMAVMIGLVTGRWGVYGRGWPMELLLIGLLLTETMAVSGEIWTLIPAAILLGNGYLFSFYTITGFWGLWAVLWPLEPLLVVGSIWFTMTMSGKGKRAAQFSRNFAVAVRRPTRAMIIILPILGAVLN